MLMSLEIPSAHLHEIHPLVDMHFVIASELKKNKDYYNFYKDLCSIDPSKRPSVFLDNGMYEEGHPLSPTELLDITLDLQPDIVFAPDQHPSLEETKHLSVEFINKFMREVPIRMLNSKRISIGIIPQGKDAEEVTQCYDYLVQYLISHKIPPCIGLSFLNDRPQVIKILKEKKMFDFRFWYHMLGLYNVHEFKEWKLPVKQISFDTVKPIKAAYHGFNVETFPRGKGKWSTEMIVEDKALMFRNIAFLRKEASTYDTI